MRRECLLPRLPSLPHHDGESCGEVVEEGELLASLVHPLRSVLASRCALSRFSPCPPQKWCEKWVFESRGV